VKRYSKGQIVKNKRWMIYLGLTLALIACCYLVACAALGFFVGRSGARSETPAMSEMQPSPTAPPLQRLPRSDEKETARSLGQAGLPARDQEELAVRLQGRAKPASGLGNVLPPEYESGDPITFWLHDQDSNAFYTTTAILRHETPHAYWWIQDGYDVDEEALARSAQVFEEQTYPTSRRIFGSEPNPGIDNDPHVFIFLGDVPGVAGYFSGPDEYRVEIRPYSNQHEMFYINLENAGPGSGYFDGVLAHEFQHMIHWNLDRDEETWVNEGLSELAAQVNGFDVGGSDRLFTRSPDTQLTTWPDMEDSGPHYGASYLLLAYFLEEYGEEAVRELVAEPANGIAGFKAVLAEVDPEETFASFFANWVVANYLDDEAPAGGRYGYAALNLPQPSHSAQHRSFPIHERASVRQHAADYILVEGQGDLKIEFTGSTLVPLVGNQAHSGEFQWWALRGDEGDATLTRAFDLAGLEQATLQAWMWYDLELDYDYAYVQVSADGGKTWEILANEDTITTNPSGNSYGPALTGISGGGPEPVWTQQVFDLTPYGGRQILVRFEVITDESVNHPGLCLDDISILELGYVDDVESEDSGWQAEGWLRVTDQIPQAFEVQLITFGPDLQVVPMTLDAQNRGVLTLAGLGQDVTRAVLVVAAMAPKTTESATYAYRIASN
jgi:hypothetical protein